MQNFPDFIASFKDLNQNKKCKLLILVLNISETRKSKGTDFVTILLGFDGENVLDLRLFTKKLLQKILIGDLLYIKDAAMSDKWSIKPESVNILKFDDKSIQEILLRVFSQQNIADTQKLNAERIIEQKIFLRQSQPQNLPPSETPTSKIPLNDKYCAERLQPVKYIDNEMSKDLFCKDSKFLDLKEAFVNKMNYIQRMFLCRVTELTKHTKIVDMQKEGYFTFIGLLRNLLIEKNNLAILYMTDFVNDTNTNRTEQLLIIKAWDRNAVNAKHLEIGKVYIVKNIRGARASSSKSELVVQMSGSCKGEFIECNPSIFHIKSTPPEETAVDNAFATFRFMRILKPEILVFKLVFEHVYDFPIYMNKLCSCIFEQNDNTIDKNYFGCKKLVCKNEDYLFDAEETFNHDDGDLITILVLVSDHNGIKVYAHIKYTILQNYKYKCAIDSKKELVCNVLCDFVSQKNVFTIVDVLEIIG